MLLAQYAERADPVSVLAAQQKGLRLALETASAELEKLRQRHSQRSGTGETRRRAAQKIIDLRAEVARLEADYRYRSAELLRALDEQQQAAKRLQAIAERLANAATAARATPADVATGPLNERVFSFFLITQPIDR